MQTASKTNVNCIVFPSALMLYVIRIKILLMLLREMKMLEKLEHNYVNCLKKN